MRNEVAFVNRDRFLQLGLTIATLRKMRGLSQEQLAERSGVSRTHISNIETQNIIKAFSLDILYRLADALEVEAYDILKAATIPDEIIKSKIISTKIQLYNLYKNQNVFLLRNCKGVQPSVSLNMRQK